MKRISAKVWADHFHRFEQSGMNAADYCRKHRLPLARWRHWQRRLDREPGSDFVTVIENKPGMSGSLVQQIGKDVKL